MMNRLLIALSLLFLISFVTPNDTAAGDPCGTYFQSEYRAVGKIKRSSNGSNFELADWNGDGRSDFWNFRPNTSTNTADVVIYHALPTGYWNWDAPTILTTTLPTTAHTDSNFQHFLSDFDGDGKLDIWVGSVVTATNSRIHRNTGTSLTALSQVVNPASTGFSTQWMGFFDLTGDGLLDWVYSYRNISTGDQTLSYSPGTADGAFGPRVAVLAHTADNEFNTSTRRLGDFDGDGDLDIGLSSGSTAPYRIRVLKNLGGGTFELGAPANYDFHFGSVLYIGDLNGDGRADMLSDAGGVKVIFSQPNLTFSQGPSHSPSSGASLSPAAFTDFNNDGRKDLILASVTSYEIFFHNGDGTFTSMFYPIELRPTFPTLYLHFEDFNNDGKADIWDETHGIHNVFSEEVVVIKSNVCAKRGETRTFNFNGDSTIDIATWTPASGQWKTKNALWMLGPPYPPTMTFSWGLGSLGDVPAPGDFDGDGKTDHTVYRDGEGNWYSYLSATGSWSVFRFGLSGDIPIPNDYNGGGSTDYAVFRPSDGTWYIWYTETQHFAAVRWGTNGDRPVPADYDGDRKTDIAVFRPSSGEWYYLRSSDLGYNVVRWGLSDDIPLPADYDGDGKADIMIYRAGGWYLLPSLTGTSAVFFWGTAADIPIPVMANGEVAAPVIYRTSDSRWFPVNTPPGVILTLEGDPIYFGLPND